MSLRMRNPNRVVVGWSCQSVLLNTPLLICQKEGRHLEALINFTALIDDCLHRSHQGRLGQDAGFQCGDLTSYGFMVSCEGALVQTASRCCLDRGSEAFSFFWYQSWQMLWATSIKSISLWSDKNGGHWCGITKWGMAISRNMPFITYAIN